MALIIASLAIISVLCYGIFRVIMWHLRRRRLYKLASKFQGPPILPIIGCAHILLGNTEHILSKLNEIGESYPSPCRVWIGPQLVFIITDPVQIKVICLSPKSLEKSQAFRDLSRPLFGSGLLTSDVSTWRSHRKLIQPTFNTKILESFVEVFATQSKILTNQIKRNLDGPEFEIFNFMSSCTLDMVCETAMGIEVKAQTSGNSDYLHALQETLATIVKRFFHFWLQPDFIFYGTKRGRDQQKNTKYLYDFVDNVIRKKQEELLERQSQPSSAADTEDDVCDPTPRREPFLDQLMKQPKGTTNLSDEALRDEVITMVLAGNDTAAIAMSFVMLMLASHPDIQEIAHQEIYEIYGDADLDDRPVTLEDLSNMKYLERVIKETLRMFPPAPFILREVTEDLDTGEHTLPTGSTVAVAILSLHRNAKYWPDPFKFDPDRFLPEENAKRHPYSFMAFSGGPRNCVGLNYGMMSMKTLAATILRKYIIKKNNIVPSKDIRLKFEFLALPVDPITIRIENRTRNNNKKTQCMF